jgi:dTDP-4-dehydrorhamnose reductase
MKILVTGARGGLGGELPTVFSDDTLILLDQDQLDITDKDSAVEAIRTHKPDAIIHAAAYTNVDAAESNPEDAKAVNQTGTANVVAGASEVSAVMIYPSTDYVFNGKKREPYAENNPTNPLSVYGATKLAGEQEALTYDRSYVIRTSWLYSHTGKSFVSTMLKLFETKDELKVVADETSSPTYARDFAHGLKKLLETRPEAGTYHLSGGGETNWFEYAQEIAKLAGSDIKLEPTTAAEWDAPAKRPAYSKLDSGRLAKTGIELPNWKDSLKQFFHDRP